MEDVYTIKVKTKPDTRNLYPSERRYSASTVSGLAWVHIALAATSFLLACLAIVNPNTDIKRLNINDAVEKIVDKNELTFNFNITLYDDVNTTNSTNDLNNTNDWEQIKSDNTYILVLAPTLLTVFALAAGIASIMASVRWYVDHNITWLFVMSIFSTLFSLIAFIMVAVWFGITADDDGISEFYKDKIPFKDYVVIKHTDVVDRNESHMLVAKNSIVHQEDTTQLFTKSVLSINILIAAFLELLWSILSLKISYKGMKSNYRDDDNERRGNCISVVTTIKGNDTRKLPRNGKMISHKPDLIEHYPSKKIKRLFLSQTDEGYYLKNQNNKAKQNTETSSEFYKERMMNFLNRCASLEGISNPETQAPSVHSEVVLNAIPEVASVEINMQETNPDPEVKGRVTPLSWGDTPDHTIYNQNTLNLEKIFNFAAKKDVEAKESDKNSEETSENVKNN